jgi:hypothetical protein
MICCTITLSSTDAKDNLPEPRIIEGETLVAVIILSQEYLEQLSKSIVIPDSPSMDVPIINNSLPNITETTQAPKV